MSEDDRWVLSVRYDSRKRAPAARFPASVYMQVPSYFPNMYELATCTCADSAGWEEDADPKDHCLGRDDRCGLRVLDSLGNPTLESCWEFSYREHIKSSRKVLQVVENGVLGLGQRIELEMIKDLTGEGLEIEFVAISIPSALTDRANARIPSECVDPRPFNLSASYFLSFQYQPGIIVQDYFAAILAKMPSVAFFDPTVDEFDFCSNEHCLGRPELCTHCLRGLGFKLGRDGTYPPGLPGHDSCWRVAFRWRLMFGKRLECELWLLVLREQGRLCRDQEIEIAIANDLGTPITVTDLELEVAIDQEVKKLIRDARLPMRSADQIKALTKSMNRIIW